ncbi:MAG: hypothetical protein JSW72_03800 [Candidatus Bathyarchaeota archaeon]|nr:MAG: hypothetical protein JSW72_03800 [Candidatus Bathyarchaeota archaeon]
MIDISSINAISGIIAAVGVIVGVVFAVFQLRDFVKTRRADLILRLQASTINKEFIEAFQKVMSLEFEDHNDYLKKYGPTYFTENPTNISRTKVLSTFELLGLLLHRKLVDIDLVGEIYPVSTVWEKMKPTIEGTRKQFNAPRVFEFFEYFEERTRLYRKMRKGKQAPQALQ